MLSHLRLVVSVARGYLGYGLPHADLIQEGNIGLMKAVKRFDPERGVRLVSFAIHWIKAEIHEYILRNWRLVKVATTKAQRKLFFNLRSMKQGPAPLTSEEVGRFAAELKVKPEEVAEMEMRLSGRDDRLRSRRERRRRAYAPVHYLAADPEAEPSRVLEAEQNGKAERRACRARSPRSTRAAAASSRRAGCRKRTAPRCTTRRRVQGLGRAHPPDRGEGDGEDEESDVSAKRGATPAAGSFSRIARAAYEDRRQVLGDPVVPHEQAQPALRVEDVALRAVVDRVAPGAAGRFSKKILNSLAARCVAARSPYRPRKRGSNAGTYWPSTAGVSRSGSTVTNSTCTRSASLPSFFITPAMSASVVGQTSGQCV